MARPATGNIMERPNAAGSISRTLRFYAGGKRREIALGPVTRKDAEERLRHELADVERGIWQPPTRARAQRVSVAPDMPTFHAFADEWWLRNRTELSKNTQLDYKWRLEKHLLGYFGAMPLDTIKPQTVDAYISAKLASGLSARSVNMTVTLLASILDDAVEYEPPMIVRNPARSTTRGKRRAKEREPRRSYLESAWQIQALLDAAGELDKVAHIDRRHVERRAMLATLTFAGLRIGELCSLRWQDVDLQTGWLSVQDAKTTAGRRRVRVRAALGAELASVRARTRSLEGYVFPTSTGKRMSPENFRNRVLAAAVKRANEDLMERGQPTLPDRLTPHSLRRTFCSLLYALGEDPGTVMDEMGHTDPALALRVYRHAMRRGQEERDQLRELIGFRRSIGDKSDSGLASDAVSGRPDRAKVAHLQAI